MLRSLIFLFLAGPALADEPGVSSASYLQASLALGLILALLFGLAWLARKVAGNKGFGQGGMKVIGGVALGPRERIVMVEAGDTWLVVGIVPGQIRTLHRMPRAAEDAAPEAAPKTFADWLQNLRPPK